MATSYELDTIATVRGELTAGRLSSVALTSECLKRIDDPENAGARSFIRVYGSRALDEARAADRVTVHGREGSALAGIPISVKDLFDIAGEATTAGSIALVNAPAATRDAQIVQRLREAGAIVLGRSNMTEFAYSALGLNPHYGTPGNPRDASRIPGGSSSGAATAVAHELCVASIGTDTAGSVRVPAAFCGLVGFKPTQARIPRDGVFPLSTSLDSIGAIARSTACCALLDAIMAGDVERNVAESPIKGLRLAVPRDMWTDGLDEPVARTYDRALRRISAAGACLIAKEFAAVTTLAEVERCSGLIGPEAYATHRALLRQHGDQYDPRVRSRLDDSAGLTAADYIGAVRLRHAAVDEFTREAHPFDAVLAPTVAVVPPRFAELESEGDYRRINALVRRNASAVNVLDGCALTIPCHDPDELPVGLMIIGVRGADSHVLAIGMALERVLGVTNRARK